MGYNGSVQGSSLPYQFHIPDATDNTSGTMSAADKTKLDGIPAGGAGPAGVNAFTATTASFVQPAVSASVVVAVAESSWAVPGQVVYVENGGYYTVASVPDSTHIGLTNRGESGNALPGATVPSGSGVSPGGIEGPGGAAGFESAFGASLTAIAANNAVPIGMVGISADAVGRTVNSTREFTKINVNSSVVLAGGGSLDVKLFISYDGGGTYAQLGSTYTVPNGSSQLTAAIGPLELLAQSAHQISVTPRVQPYTGIVSVTFS